MRLVPALKPGWHTGERRWQRRAPRPPPEPFDARGEEHLPDPCVVIYYCCGALAESAVTALQHFAFAEEFPLLSLRGIIPSHSQQQQPADAKLRDPTAQGCLGRARLAGIAAWSGGVFFPCSKTLCPGEP